MPWYTFVHNSDGKYWGLPIKMTVDDKLEFDASEYADKMLRKGYKLKRVKEMKSYTANKDKYFHEIELNHCADELHNPDLAYMDTEYTYHRLSGKAPAHPGY